MDINFCHIHVEKNIPHKIKSNHNLNFIVRIWIKRKAIQQLKDNYAFILNSVFYTDKNN